MNDYALVSARSIACKVCYVVTQTIQSNATFDEIYLGTYGEIRDNVNCKTCQQIAVFRKIAPSSKMELLRVRKSSSEYQIADEDYTDFMMDIIPLQANGPKESHGVLFDPLWINIDRIKSWVRFCNLGHGGSCLDSPQTSSMRPVETLLVIDVIDGRLVRMCGNVRYFALSYVWGQLAATAETRKDNLEPLTQPGAINVDACKLNLPHTIKDAIRLVKSLGDRFLWVDRLCIIQDDFENKSMAIQQMGAIYANAYCTIVAADGNDADHGLRGIGSGSKPRSCTQTILNFPDYPVLLQQDLDAEKKARWITRGWTYQEQLCSRRLLMFAGNTVIWRCQRCEWREDITAQPEGAERPPLLEGDQMLLKFSKWPNLIQWRDLVSHYNRRELTFQTDIRAAFAGIESIIADAFPGGFCNGLPELFFDAAILWQPLNPMRRRPTPTPVGQHARRDIETLVPSWSWLGWHGNLDPLGWIAGLDYLKLISTSGWHNQSTLRVMPLVEWEQVDRVINDHYGGIHRHRPIQNHYHLWRDASTKAGPEEVYPPAAIQGWRRHSDENRRQWFSHPEAEGARFGYPVPLTDDAEDSSNAQTPPYARWSPFLRLRSSCAFFEIGAAIPSLDMRRTLCVAVRDVSDRWAGVLRLNEPISATAPEDLRCELVAISRGSAHNDADESSYLEEWNLEHRPANGPEYLFYNVLWIERESDGCVTRKALGRIEKSIWDSQALKDIDVTLR